jgi:hypothetical protein
MTKKHQATGNRLKPMVRIHKNFRNKMIEKGIIKVGTAPSYFIEGMLSNVPVEHFSGTYQKSVEACWGWIDTCDHGSLMCANAIHPLVREQAPPLGLFKATSITCKVSGSSGWNGDIELHRHPWVGTAFRTEHTAMTVRLGQAARRRGCGCH